MAFDRVATWPVFLDRTMHEDARVRFSVADTVSWDVILVDGETEGWPQDRLIETGVRIEERPDFAHHGRLARIETVRSHMARDASGVWRPVGPWQLTDVSQTPRRLASRPANPAAERDLGFLIGLELRSHTIQRFPPRSTGSP